MRIAHLILAHKNSAQLERIIYALNHPAFDFYIHIDKKSDISQFNHLAEIKNVFLIKKRSNIYWAGYGTIQATINGFEEILPKDYDYINVISAQDFPLRSANAIYNYITERNGTQFITCESVKDEWPEAEIRVRKYYLVNWKIPGKYALEALINKLLPERKFPLDYKIVGRANWFTITKEAALYMLDFINQHPDIVRFFKFSWGADELIFSTILYNSPFKNKIEPNLVYVDWTGATKGHPRILNSSDFDKLVQSDKLFARKFDIAEDEIILKMLEDHIAKF